MTNTLPPDQQLTLARALWPEREFLLSADGEPLECRPPNYWDGLSTFTTLPSFTSPEAIGLMVSYLDEHAPERLAGLLEERMYAREYGHTPSPLVPSLQLLMLESLEEQPDE